MDNIVRWLQEIIANADLGQLTNGWVNFEVWVAVVFLVVCHYGVVGLLINCVISGTRFSKQHSVTKSPWQTFTDKIGTRHMFGFGLISTKFFQARKHWFECALERQGIQKSTYKVSSSLDWNDIQYDVVLIRLSKLVPPMLIGIGILGTFVGLTAGITEVQRGDQSQLAQNVDNVLGGMSLAFITSIFGIGLSLVWSLMHKLLMGISRGALVFIGRRVDIEFPTWSDDELNKALVDDQLQQTKAIKHLAGDLATQLGASMQKSLDVGLVQPMADFRLLHKTLVDDQLQQTEAINRLGVDLTTQMKTTMEDSLNQGLIQPMADFRLLHKTLVDDQLQQTEAIKHMGGDLADQLGATMDNSLNEGLVQPMAQFMTKIEDLQSSSAEKLADTVSGSIDEIIGKEFNALRDVLQELIRFHGDTAEHLQTTVDVLRDSGESHQALLIRLETAAENTDDYITNMVELQSKIESASKEMQTTAQAMATASDSSSESTAKQRELLELVVRELESAQNTWKGTQHSLQSLTTALEGSVGTFKEDISTTVKQAHSEFDSLMAEAVTRLSGTIAEMREGNEESTLVVRQLTKHSKGLSEELLKQQKIYSKTGKSIELISKQLAVSLDGQESAQ